MEKKSVATTVKREHKLNIQGQKSVVIYGVEEVISLTSELLIVQLNAQVLMLKGKNFNMKKLAVEEGYLEIDGSVSECKYSNKREKKNIFKRMFG